MTNIRFRLLRRDWAAGALWKEIRLNADSSLKSDMDEFIHSETSKAIQSKSLKTINRLKGIVKPSYESLYRQMRDCAIEILIQDGNLPLVSLLYEQARREALQQGDKQTAALLWFAEFKMLKQSSPRQAVYILRELEQKYNQLNPCEGKTVQQYMDSLSKTSKIRKLWLESKTPWGTGTLARSERDALDSAPMTDRFQLAFLESNNPFFADCQVSLVDNFRFSTGIVNDAGGREIAVLPRCFPIKRNTLGEMYQPGEGEKNRFFVSAGHLIITQGNDRYFNAYNTLVNPAVPVWDVNLPVYTQRFNDTLKQQQAFLDKNISLEKNLFVDNVILSKKRFGVHSDVLVSKVNQNSFAAFDLLDGRLRWLFYLSSGVSTDVQYIDSAHAYLEISQYGIPVVPKNAVAEKPIVKNGRPSERLLLETGESDGFYEFPPGVNIPFNEGMFYGDSCLNPHYHFQVPPSNRKTEKTYINICICRIKNLSIRLFWALSTLKTINRFGRNPLKNRWRKP